MLGARARNSFPVSSSRQFANPRELWLLRSCALPKVGRANFALFDHLRDQVVLALKTKEDNETMMLDLQQQLGLQTEKVIILDTPGSGQCAKLSTL